MNPDLMQRVYRTWRKHFHLDDSESKPGITLSFTDKWNANSFIVLWPVGEHVVVEAAVDVSIAVMREVIAQIPPNERVTIEDFKRAWGEIETSAMPMYALDPERFRPFAVPAGYMLRQLTTEDQPAFDSFLGHCSEEDKDEGDVSIDHMIAFGVFEGARIVAAASVFMWRGFIDIGILTDPLYRGRGLAKAAVSACAAHYLPGDLVVGYRHDAANRGSQGIAQGLGFTQYATVEMLKKPVA